MNAVKISEILKNAAGHGPVFSFEFFPPKNADGEALLYKTISELRELKPDFVSVTYGAGGSTREKTRDWVSTVQDRYEILAMAHYTCVGSSRAEIVSSLMGLHRAGIRNIMALRGDPPKGVEHFSPAPDGLRYASELIAFIRQSGLDFCLGGACYPEVHLEAASAGEDLQRLKEKVDAGTDFLVTQLFFQNDAYFQFVENCRSAGIHVPIIPGIMPITQMAQIARFTQMAGCTIPEDLIRELTLLADDPDALRRASIAYSVRQCSELMAGGAPGLHFYTLNQSHATMEILRGVQAGLIPGGRQVL